MIPHYLKLFFDIHGFTKKIFPFFFFICLIKISMAHAIQVDLHLDTPTQIFKKKIGLDSLRGLEAGLPQLKAGGTNIAMMVLWPPLKSDHLKRTMDLLRVMEKEIQRLDEVVLIHNPDEARNAVKGSKIGIMLSLEGAHGLGHENWKKVLEILHKKGLSAIGITWSFSNRFAGSSADEGGGLTQVGFELVRECFRRGIIMDVSHASRETTLQICSQSPVPVIASHSDAYSIKAHHRNLRDEEIRCIAETGGVIGLNFHAPFIGKDADIKLVADHADYISKIGGHRSVALGSDFDGFIKKPRGLEDAGKLKALWDELRSRGWSKEQIKGIQGENFLRAWKKVLDGSEDKKKFE
ncbi:MAG TPA: hypothetical protein DIT94_01350 [Deltaproteobacteria bacterium]|nr:hypothetical protein [Deltaproteobacteria bacterium]